MGPQTARTQLVPRRAQEIGHQSGRLPGNERLPVSPGNAGLFAPADQVDFLPAEITFHKQNGNKYETGIWHPGKLLERTHNCSKKEV